MDRLFPAKQDLLSSNTVFEKFESLSLPPSKWTASDLRRETAQLKNRK
jgi:hypothetical protein